MYVLLCVSKAGSVTSILVELFFIYVICVLHIKVGVQGTITTFPLTFWHIRTMEIGNGLRMGSVRKEWGVIPHTPTSTA